VIARKAAADFLSCARPDEGCSRGALGLVSIEQIFGVNEQVPGRGQSD